MRQTQVQVILTVFIFLGAVYSSPAYAKETKPSRAKKNSQKVNKTFSKHVIEEDSSENKLKKNNDLVRMIKGFQMVIKMEENVNKKQQLILSQSSAYLALARNIRLDTKSSKVKKENEKTSLDRVLINSQVILKSKEADAATKSKAHYYSGIASSYLGQNQKMIEHFKQSLSLNPNSSWAPATAIAIAENYFENEMYEQSIRQYKVYYSRYNYDQKSLSTYKMAWAYLNLNRLTDAENFFLYLVHKPWAKEFAVDSLKDLAYVTTLYRTEEDIISYSIQHLSQDPIKRVDFLTYVFKYFFQQSMTKPRNILLAEILNNEKRISKRINILILNLRGQQKQYASLKVFYEFLKIKNELITNKVEITSADFTENAAELEFELLALTKSYYDTFVEKTKTPENLTKLSINKNLEELLEFHSNYFPDSKEREKTLSLWFSVCSELKSPECTYKVSKKILADPRVAQLRQKAFAEYILSMDTLSKKDKKYREEMIGALLDFSTKEEKSEDWLNLTKKLTALLNEDKRYPESLPFLDKINVRTPSAESLYRLILVQFEMGQYEKISTTQVAYNDDKLVPEILKIQRQSRLKMAQDGLQANDYDKYQTNILAYIKEEKDKSKSYPVLKDYLIRTLEKGDIDQVYQTLLSLPRADRTNDIFMPVTSKVILQFMQTSKWSDVNLLLTPFDFKSKTQKDLHFTWFADQLELNKSLSDESYDQILKSDEKTKKTMLGFLSIYYPEIIVSKFKKNPSKEEFVKKSAFLAAQIYGKRWDISLTPEMIKLLGNDIVPPEIRNQDLTQTEKSLLAIELPKYDVNPKTLSKKTKIAVDTVVASRSMLVRALKDKLPQIKLRILDTAIKAENDMAQFLLYSPIPDGLAPDQIDQYQGQIKEIAGGFTTQADEYKKIKKNIEDSVTSPARVLNLDNLDSMSFKDVPIVSHVKKMVRENQYSSAGMAIEFWRAENGADQETYYGLRSYILLSMQNSQFMQEYVSSELTGASQVKWIEHLKQGITK